MSVLATSEIYVQHLPMMPWLALDPHPRSEWEQSPQSSTDFDQRAGSESSSHHSIGYPSV